MGVIYQTLSLHLSMKNISGLDPQQAKLRTKKKKKKIKVIIGL